MAIFHQHFPKGETAFSKECKGWKEGKYPFPWKEQRWGHTNPKAEIQRDLQSNQRDLSLEGRDWTKIGMEIYINWNQISLECGGLHMSMGSLETWLVF